MLKRKSIHLMKQQNSTKSGFTVVELFIVVIIVAMLALLTFVALNSIQTRARNSAAQIAANSLTKKIHSYYSLAKSYPSTASTVITTLATYKESSLGTANIAIGTPSNSNGTNTLKVELCGMGAGVIITPFNFLTGNLSTAINIGNVGGGCTIATA